MVFLDQESVEQTDAVIVAAAAGDCVLLCQAQAGKGLAGIQQFDPGTFHQIGKIPAAGRSGGQRLDEIQRAALTGQQAAGRAAHSAEGFIRRQLVAIGGQPFNLDLRIHLAEHLISPGRTAENGGFPGNDGRLSLPVRRDQRRGDVAIADILGQCAAHLILKGGLQTVQGDVRHGLLR